MPKLNLIKPTKQLIDKSRIEREDHARKLLNQIENEPDIDKRAAFFEQIVETLNLQQYSIREHGLEIRSDQKLSPQDLEFISEVKLYLDDSLNGGRNKPINIFILNQKNWPVIAMCMHLSGGNEFSGASVELPITPFTGMQAVLLPSIDAIGQGVRRRDQIVSLVRNDPEIRTFFAGMDEEEKEEVYRSFYLRNMIAHEMCHLYQLSPVELASITSLSENPEQASIEYSRFLPLREWLACAQGLYEMKHVQERHRQIFLRINKLVADKLIEVDSKELTQEQLYPIVQANRTIQADAFFQLCKVQSSDAVQILIRMNQICASDDEKIKEQLQNIISGEMNKEKLNELIKFLGVKKTNDYEPEQEFVFPSKERNHGVQTETFGSFSEDESVVMERLKIRLKDKEFIIAGIGSEQFSSDNEEDKEIEYLLRYAAEMHIPILFLTPIGTKNGDYFQELHYQSADNILAMSKRMGIEIEFAGNLFSSEDKESPEVEKIFKNKLEERFGKKQCIILTDGSPIVGGSKLLMKSIRNSNTLVIDRKSKIDEIADTFVQRLNIDSQVPRVILNAQDYLTNPDSPINMITVIYNLHSKNLFLKVLGKLIKACGDINTPILIQSPTDNPKLTNLNDLLKEIQNTSEDDLFHKHLTIAFYV